jgi:hypothetical protein
VQFIANGSGLRIRTHNVDVAVEHHQTGSFMAEQFAAPQSLLGDCEGRKDESVKLEVQGDGKIVAQWRDGGVPQLTQYHAEDPGSRSPFPGCPTAWSENQPDLLRALDDAVHTTGEHFKSYNLNCWQLLGESGSIATTDGHQFLWQTGFQFPWKEDLLVPANLVFSSAVLPMDLPVRVGEAGGHVVFACGPWTIWLTKFVDGRFPKVAELLSRGSVPACRCTFTANDLRYLAQTLNHLPVAEDESARVTIELNGHPRFRAQGSGHPEPTEIVLVGTPVEGVPVSVASDRRFVERAVHMGLPKLHLSGEDAQLRAFDERRTYIWMPLEKDAVVRSSANAIRIEPKPDEPASVTAPPKPRRKPVPKVQTPSEATVAPTEPAAKPVSPAAAEPTKKTQKPREARPAAVASPIEQTKALLAFQREQIVKTKDLLAALRRQQKQSKVVSATLAQLKELQKIA